MEFCKICGMPLDESVKVYECAECKFKVDGSCAREVEGKVVCDKCIKKKDDIKKRAQEKWQNYIEKRKGNADDRDNN